MPAVLVTGASGYIGAHIVSQLLEKKYTVIGTVRTGEKAKFLIEKFEDPNLSFEIVPDIAEATAFDAAFEVHPEIEFVVHTAAVLPRGVPKEELHKQYVETSVAGTINILKTIEKYGPSVRHFVLTSSSAALADLRLFEDSTILLTEDSWNETSWEQVGDFELFAYAYSKAEAERSAKEFTKRPEVKFTFSSVCPVWVLGPQRFVEMEGNSSSEAQLVASLVNAPVNSPGPFDTWGAAVDVRDVAKAHVLSVEKYAEFKDARLVLANAEFTSQLLLNIINQSFPELVGKIPAGNMVDHTVGMKKSHAAIDFSKTAEITGIEFIPLEKTIIDGVKQILEYNALKK
ncbi:unnamed protein product [Kuraishia capsulata CBS 1993]|uniref:NAD-dependent epimerase/dehydratase domain-containing protein n=1 Tax=Kuraishia capsulata CBS 1993 TaxID=1382522 RepID=W6MMN9_9ASCO|nr:uncharacterized protein KUCA_T00002193001 [Kuraishia capsulata CBS 1993]CDK26222.1 unnamed protein product [Kuraishia capsulata CBS 1993]